MTSPAADPRVPAGRSGDRPALRRCIAIDTERFARQVWGREALHTSAADLAGPGGFADLLTLDAVDEIVSRRGLRTPFVRMAKDGTVVDAKRFTRGGGAGAEIGDQVADDQVLGLFADGTTLVLQGLHRLWPPLIDFAAQLTTDLGHPVQINAYITPPQSRGFSAHYDVHDVFVLQVAGEKRWRVHRPVLEAPLRDQVWTDRRDAVARRAAEAPAIEAVLRPGDALYLPRGWLHAADALGEVSAHLTVGVQPVTRYAVVEALTALAAADPALRRSLPLGVDVADPAAIAGDVRAAAGALRDWLERADPAPVADRLRRRVWPMSRPGPLAPIAQAVTAAQLTTASLLVARPHLRARATVTGETLQVVLSDRRLALPAAAEGAVKAVLAGAPVAVGELPGLPPDDQLDLARRLLREGVAVPADPGAAGASEPR